MWGTLIKSLKKWSINVYIIMKTKTKTDRMRCIAWTNFVSTLCRQPCIHCVSASKVSSWFPYSGDAHGDTSSELSGKANFISSDVWRWSFSIASCFGIFFYFIPVLYVLSPSDSPVLFSSPRLNLVLILFPLSIRASLGFYLLVCVNIRQTRRPEKKTKTKLKGFLAVT